MLCILYFLFLSFFPFGLPSFLPSFLSIHPFILPSSYSYCLYLLLISCSWEWIDEHTKDFYTSYQLFMACAVPLSLGHFCMSHHKCWVTVLFIKIIWIKRKFPAQCYRSFWKVIVYSCFELCLKNVLMTIVLLFWSIFARVFLWYP